MFAEPRTNGEFKNYDDMSVRRRNRGKRFS